MFRKKWQLSLTVAFASLGLLLSLQFSTHKAMKNDLNSQNSETLAAIARNLTSKYYQLIREVWDLRTQLKFLEQTAGQNKSVLEAMKREQQKLSIAIGSNTVEGSGIIITIPGNDQNYFGYQDVIDIVNELWNAGAEGISVNGIRISHNTYVTSGEEYSIIVINGKRISYPYVIKAIGEPAALDKGISIPSGIIDNLKAVYKIPLEIEQSEKLVLPPASPPEFKYSRPVTE